MNCPKHPFEKMTLLFTSWICDICNPSNGIDLKYWKKYVPSNFNLTLVEKPSIKHLTYHSLHNTLHDCDYDLIIVLNERVKDKIDILHNRYVYLRYQQACVGIFSITKEEWDYFAKKATVFAGNLIVCYVEVTT